MFSESRSLLFYCILFITSANLMGFIAKDHKKKNFFYKVVTLIAFGIPVLMAAFRSCGSDTLEYMMSYIRYSKAGWAEIIKSIDGIGESGHVILMKLMEYFKSVRIYFGVYAALTVFFAYLAAKNLKKETLAIVMMMFFFGTFASSFNIMRQGLAVALVMYSFKFVFERDFKKFLLTILLATSFHTSAILASVVYFIWTKEGKLLHWSFLVLGFFAVLGLSLGLESVLGFLAEMDIESEALQRYTGYTNNEIGAQNRDFYLRLLVTAVVVLHYKKLVELDKKNSFFIYLVIISTALGACGFISPYAKRMASYFSIAQYFVLPDISKTYDDSKSARLARVGVVVYTVARFTLVYFFLKQSNLIPYIWVLPSWARF